MASSSDCRVDDSYGSYSGDDSKRSCSNRMNSPTSKKQRVIEETLVDRISELPDPLLIQILSLLPTKDAFSTSILSKRWIPLSTFVDSFNFSPRDFRKTENGSSFVEYVLAHSISSKLKKFEFELEFNLDHLHELSDVSYISYMQSLMSRCLSFAVDRNVENVVICFCRGEWSPLPQSFYTCSSLITLVVSHVFFEFDGVIEWKSLKSLKLEVLHLTDDDIVNLLAGCPALETLELSRIKGFHHLEINSLKLKRLNLKFPLDLEEPLEIFAPYLEHLEISGNLCKPQCRLVDVSSVVNAKLTFYIRCTKDPSRLVKTLFSYEDEDSDDEEDLFPNEDEDFDDEEDLFPDEDEDFDDEEDLFPDEDEDFDDEEDLFPDEDEDSDDEEDLFPKEDKDFDDEEDNCHDYHQAFGTVFQDYFRKLSNATEVTIGTWFADALCMLQIRGVSIPELKCKYLMIESSDRQEFNLYGAAGLSRASPHMETLSIDVETRTPYKSHSLCRFGSRYLGKGDDIDLQSWISSSVFPKLKKVEIVLSSVDDDMDNRKWGFDKVFKICEFLLKTATVLEEFVIISKREQWIRSNKCVPMCLFKLAKKLLNCQRSSGKAMIIFKDRAEVSLTVEELLHECYLTLSL